MTHFGATAGSVVKSGHSAKECQNNFTMENQDQTHNSPTNIQPSEPIKYHTQYLQLGHPYVM